MFSIIVAVDENFGIGYKNNLLYKISEDLKRFKLLTMGKKILVGRKTFESIKNKLPGRKIIIASKNKDLLYENAVICSDLKNFFIENINTPEEIFIIGGAEIYSLAMPYTKKIYLTRIKYKFTADSFFPEINNYDWEKSFLSASLCDKNNIKFRYEIYVRKKILIGS